MADILRSNFVVTVIAATLLVAMDSAGTALLMKQRREMLHSRTKMLRTFTFENIA